MDASPRIERSSWGIPAAVALPAAVLALSLFRAPVSAPVAAIASRRVEIVRLKTFDASISDPSALFLPNQWSTRTGAMTPDLAGDMGGGFAPFPAILTIPETSGRVSFPAVAAVPEKPVDALAIANPGPPFPGMGRTDRPVTPLPPRDAAVEVMSLRTGDTLFARDVPVKSGLPRTAAWRPMEFQVHVEAAGMVGLPVVTSSSGADLVDNFFQNYLAKEMHLGEQLPPGNYRVSIGP